MGALRAIFAVFFFVLHSFRCIFLLFDSDLRGGIKSYLLYFKLNMRRKFERVAGMGDSDNSVCCKCSECVSQVVIVCASCTAVMFLIHD